MIIPTHHHIICQFINLTKKKQNKPTKKGRAKTKWRTFNKTWAQVWTQGDYLTIRYR